jgi:hypothetical protein
MKKLLLVALTLMVSTMAFAQDCRWGIDHRHHNCGPRWEPRTVIVERNDWIAPLIIGGIAGAVIANQNQQQPVVVQQPQTVIVQTQTVCTAWKEIQQPDGQIYRERTCTK